MTLKVMWNFGMLHSNTLTNLHRGKRCLGLCALCCFMTLEMCGTRSSKQAVVLILVNLRKHLVSVCASIHSLVLFVPTLVLNSTIPAESLQMATPSLCHKNPGSGFLMGHPPGGLAIP